MNDAGTTLPVFVGMTMLFLCNPCIAAGDDPYNLVVSEQLMTDSNLFRVPGGSDPKSERIAMTSAGFSINKPYSLQLFQLSGDLVGYRYAHNTYLDFTARNYAAAWRWSATPALAGNLTADRQQMLNSFTDYHGNLRNIRSAVSQRFDADFNIDGVWHALGAVRHARQEDSQLFVQEGDTRLDTAELSVRYVTDSGGKLTLTGRRGNGDYFNRPAPLPVVQLDTGFSQTESEATLSLPVTGKSTLDARLTWLSRQHEHFSDRNYAGLTGRIGLDWGLTDRTKLTVAQTRDLTSYQGDNSSYYAADRSSIASSWLLSDHVTVRANYDWTARQYRGAIGNGPQANWHEHLYGAAVSLIWQPLRSIAVTGSYQLDKRNSQESGFGYDSNMFMLTARLML